MLFEHRRDVFLHALGARSFERSHHGEHRELHVRVLIAAETLVVISPGVNYCRFDDLNYRNLRTGVRLGPLGKVHMA